MVSRVLFVIVAALLAWHFGPSVIAGLIAVFPFLGSIFAALVPDISGRSFADYLIWILATLIVWVLLKVVVGLASGIVLPASQRFGTTKLLRRFQWVLYNLFIVFDFYLVLCAGFIVRIVVEPPPPLVVVFDSELPSSRRYAEIVRRKADVQNSPVSSVFSLMWGALTGSQEGSPVRYLVLVNDDPRGALPWMALIAFVLLQRFVKSRMGRIYPPVLRFLQIGRFGMGGSGRFAGQVEEWGLRWKVGFDSETKINQFGGWLESVFGGWGGARAAGKEAYRATLEKYTPDLRGTLDAQEAASKARREGRRRYYEMLPPAEVSSGDKSYRVKGGLFMGRSLYSRFVHVGSESDQHMLTVASSRSGKGVSCIIPNLLTFSGSVICIDPKGTNAAVTAARRKAMGQNVYVIDPFEVVTKHLGMEQSDGFNPLSMLDPDGITIREDIEVIAEALVVPSDEVKNASHWDEGAKTVISGLIAHALTTFKNPSLPMIREMMMLPPEKQDRMWAEMGVNRKAGDLPRDAGMRIVQGGGSEEMQNILSGVNKNTEWLSGVAMKNVLTRSSFKFSEIKERPTTIYLVLPMHYLSRHQRFLRLFVNLAMLQMSKGGKSPHPVLALLDEFLALGRMNEISRGFRELAGYNLILWPFVQDLSGLQNLYKQDFNAFLANSRAVQMFAVNDQASLDYAAREVGERNMSYIFGLNSLRSTALRTPKEIAIETSRSGNCQYILRPGEPPLLLEKVKYYEDRSMVSQSDPPPDWLLPIVRKMYPFWSLYGKDPDYT